MSIVRKCWVGDCVHNCGNYECGADSIAVGTDGSCCTYEEKDIYKEVEGFGRDGPKEESLCPTCE